MEKLTISRIGQVKEIAFTNKKTGKPDSFKKVGVQTNEYGERWFDVSFRGDVPVVVGQSYDFEIKEREYNGKTYYDAQLPRENRRGGGGMSQDQFDKFYREVSAANLNSLKAVKLISELGKRLRDAGVIKGPTTSEGTEIPFSSPEDDIWGEK